MFQAFSAIWSLKRDEAKRYPDDMQNCVIVSVLLAIVRVGFASFPITHGVGAGEATAKSAVIWSRTNSAGA